MRLFVTGGSGFLGGALLDAARTNRIPARALARSASAANSISQHGAEPARGDLLDANAIRKIVRPDDTVVHCAAHVELTGPWRNFQRLTINATRQLLAAAIAAHARRFIYISTAGVYAGLHGNAPFSARKNTPTPPAFNYYARAKLIAEHLVESACHAARIPFTILRVGFLYGPGHRTLIDHFLHIAQRRKFRIVGTGTNHIATLFVADAAHAILAAAEAPVAANQIYDIASAEPVSQREFVNAHLTAAGAAPLTRSIPYPLAMLLGATIERVSAPLNIVPRITRASVQLFAADQRLDCTPAYRDLGWRATTPFTAGMRATASWLAQRDRGLQPTPTVE